ncbi:MAG: hypothetical protein NTX79_06030 [Candidatus Micrarchaeota archaeon]|nr:hypothetical protein [Candidatus Micrarchaeota archaeon]
MDEKIIKIVAAKLRRIGDQPINTEKLTDIREEVYKATRTNKFASFSNVKKWVKAARGHMRAQEKASASKAKPATKGKPASKPAGRMAKPAKREEEFVAPVVPRRIEDSVNFIKDENAPAMPSQEVMLPKPTIVFDKVYLQSIKFEIAGIRQTMERVSRQLDKLEKELTNHGE